jgi:co-chaperonin GroES (HSP10)
MADPELGNRASEQGQFEKGVDFEGINSSGLPVSGPMVEVDVKSNGNDLELLQKRPAVHRSIELRHSESDLLAAQMLDDPEMTSFSIPNVGTIEASPSRLSKALSRNHNREQLVWFGIDSHNMSAAMGDRIIVRRDLMESEYVCRECRGKGHTDEVCKLCDGKQQKDGQLCNQCMVLGFESEKPHPCGFVKCPNCVGSGWRNGIIIPEVAQGKPVTGVVVSIGPATTLLKLGDRVLHSKFAGHTLEMKSETYTYMYEKEVISLLRDIG